MSARRDNAQRIIRTIRNFVAESATVEPVQRAATPPTIASEYAAFLKQAGLSDGEEVPFNRGIRIITGTRGYHLKRCRPKFDALVRILQKNNSDEYGVPFGRFVGTPEEASHPRSRRRFGIWRAYPKGDDPDDGSVFFTSPDLFDLRCQAQRAKIFGKG